jgi:D-beta-D-heptose 7-phosphate kinase / D-beta-D-heptose 1-phosphate adenosyltransferase
VIVDPKGSDYAKYAGCMILTPNLGELAAAAHVSADFMDDLLDAGEKLRQSLNSQILLVTRGADGMTMLTGVERYHIPTRAREVFDVSGAGDTVIGTIAACIAAGMDVKTAVHLGNAAAGIVVGKLGTATVSWNELLSSLEQPAQQPEAKIRVA